MANPFVHIELHTSDLPAAKDFFGKLLDWTLEDVETPVGPYTIVGVGEGTGGGMMKNPVPGTPSYWLAYISVDDVEAKGKEAASLGGKILVGRTEIPDMGSFVLIEDPTGAMVALWQEAAK